MICVKFEWHYMHDCNRGLYVVYADDACMGATHSCVELIAKMKKKKLYKIRLMLCIWLFHNSHSAPVSIEQAVLTFCAINSNCRAFTWFQGRMHFTNRFFFPHDWAAYKHTTIQWHTTTGVVEFVLHCTYRYKYNYIHWSAHKNLTYKRESIQNYLIISYINLKLIRVFLYCIKCSRNDHIDSNEKQNPPKKKRWFGFERFKSANQLWPYILCL